VTTNQLNIRKGQILLHQIIPAKEIREKIIYDSAKKSKKKDDAKKVFRHNRHFQKPSREMETRYYSGKNTEKIE